MLGDSSNFTRIASVMALAADMAALGIAFAPVGRRARHSWWYTAGMRAALVVTFYTPSRAARPVARRSGGTPWARRPARWYERRRPEKTLLHRVVSDNLESWLASAVLRPAPLRTGAALCDS